MNVGTETCSICFEKFPYNAGFFGFRSPESGNFFSGYVCPTCACGDTERNYQRGMTRAQAEVDIILAQRDYIGAQTNLTNAKAALLLAQRNFTAAQTKGLLIGQENTRNNKPLEIEYAKNKQSVAARIEGAFRKTEAEEEKD